MPLKVYKVKTSNDLSVSRKPLTLFNDEKLPQRIINAPTKAAIIPFVVRCVSDFNNNKSLTPKQLKIARHLKDSNLDRKLLLGFQSMPVKVREAFDQRYFTLKKPEDVESLFVKDIVQANETMMKQLDIASKQNEGSVFDFGFTQLFVPSHTWVVTKEWADRIAANKKLQEDKAKAKKEAEEFARRSYSFERRYHGITTLKTGDQSDDGLVEPYIVQGTYSVAEDGTLQPVLKATPIELRPWSLGPMRSNQWVPSGGSTDECDYPVAPQTMIDLDFPSHDRRLFYLNMIGVYEKDSGQQNNIATAMEAAIVGMGLSELIIGSVYSAGLLAIIGAALLIAGSVSACITSILGLNNSDDHIGDIVYPFSQTEIECEKQNWTEKFEVAAGGNDWILYFGNSSWRTS
jgi:hypothetical protein